MDELRISRLFRGRARWDWLVTPTKTYTAKDVREMVLWRCNRLEGVDNGVRLGIVCSNDVDTVVNVLACLEKGVAFVPLDGKWSPDRQKTVLARMGVERVLDGSGQWPLLEKRPGLESTVASSVPAAMVLLTSGTSGAPRGVQLSSSAVVAAIHASARHLGWRENDRWILTLPLNHVGGLSVLLRCLVAKKPVCLLPRFDPSLLLASVEAGATLASLVPTMIMSLLKTDVDHQLARLRFALVGGADCPPNSLRMCWERGICALPTYGLTECASQVATALPESPQQLVPLPGVTLSIVDDTGTPRPFNEIGRIAVKSPQLMTGYVDAPPVTPPFVTADMGRLACDGSLTVVGRWDDMIITGGENVAPLAVENEMRQWPNILDVLVFGVPDRLYGEVVAVALVPDVDFEMSEFVHRCHHVFPSSMKPRHMAILAGFALLENGKRDRRAIVDLATSAMVPLSQYPST